MAAVVSLYWLTIAPFVRHELRRWERRARAIPNPSLRAHALGKLRDEHLNAEAAAVFATLAAPRWRAIAARVLVAYQVMYDYLDALSEQAVPHPLRNGCQLHRAFTAALEPHPVTIDYYRYHSERDDGKYLDTLVQTCRARLWRLPSMPIVAPLARRAATRCGEGQSRTHATPRDGVRQLEEWSLTQWPGRHFTWWELAAGATAPLSLYAHIAAATDPRTTPDDVAAVEAAYYPSICALSNLLDGLVDHADDAARAEHNYIAYYVSNTAAADRLGTITNCALAGARRLRHGSRHAVIVTGIAGFYLSTPGASSDFALPVTRSVVESLGPTFSPILAAVRLRRHVPRTRRPDR